MMHPSIDVTPSLPSLPGHRNQVDGAPTNLTNFDRGTTTLAFKFQGGIIVACDSRASQGSFVASQTVRKIIEITPYLLGTMAGGAADCSFWERHLAMQCNLHELKEGKRISPGHAAKTLSNIFMQYKGLSCGTMIAGVGHINADGTPDFGLYMVDDSGTRLQGDLFSVGSGSTFAYGVLDSGYKWDLTDEEAVDLAKRSIFHAGFRDGASGGVVRVYHVKADGWEVIIDGKELTELRKELYPTL